MASAPHASIPTYLLDDTVTCSCVLTALIRGQARGFGDDYKIPSHKNII